MGYLRKEEEKLPVCLQLIPDFHRNSQPREQNTIRKEEKKMMGFSEKERRKRKGRERMGVRKD